MADGTDGAGAGYGFGSDRSSAPQGSDSTASTGADQTQFADGHAVWRAVPRWHRRSSRGMPGGTVRHGVWPSVEPVSLRTHAIAGGGRVGLATGDPERFNVVPTAGFSIVRTGFNASSDSRLDQTAWDSYRLVNMGVGLRFNHSRMAVIPRSPFRWSRWSRPVVQRDVQLELLSDPSLVPGAWPRARFRVLRCDQ